MSFTIGADPELFLKDGDNQHRSAITRIGGTKKKPKKTEHGFVQEDNVAAEFNIPPASSAKEFSTNIGNVLNDLQEILTPQGLTFSDQASVVFPDEELRHNEAWIAGCDPDYNAWDRCINPPPGMCTNLRTVGGHIHIGIDQELSKEDWEKLVRACDLFIGVPSVFKECPTRKELYGKAGAFRPTEYGIEYRTPSNFWIFSEDMREWVYYQIERVVKYFLEEDWEVPPTVQDVINTNDKSAAAKLMEEFSITATPNVEVQHAAA